jgi:uncharacterized protein (DUF1330 family)
MAKGYWVVSYHTLPDQHTLKNVYGTLAEAAVEAGGGRFLARNTRQAGRELGAGFAERTTIVEYDDYEQALRNYDTEAYKRALKVFEDAGVLRDFRIVEALS